MEELNTIIDLLMALTLILTAGFGLMIDDAVDKFIFFGLVLIYVLTM